jgi:hypothetical protein
VVLDLGTLTHFELTSSAKGSCFTGLQSNA